MPSRRGFTLVELLIVLTVVLILVGLGLKTFGDSMRKAKVREAAAAIVSAADQARQLAMFATGQEADGFGVRLVDDPDQGEPFVEIVRLHEGGLEPVLGPDGTTPMFRQALPRTAVVWRGDRSLRDHSEPELVWLHASGTGRTHEFVSGDLSPYTVEVGRPRVQVREDWGVAAYGNALAPVLAPATGDEPGLSVRSTDGTTRIAISVFESGLATSRSYGE